MWKSTSLKVIETAWLRNLLAPWGCVALDNFPQTVFSLFFPTNKKQKRTNRTYYVKRRQKVKKLYKLIVIEIFSPSPDFIFVCLCRQRWPIEHNKRCYSSVHSYAWITPNLEKKLEFELDKDRKQDETQCSANYLTFLYIFYSVRNWHSKALCIQQEASIAAVWP